MLLPKLHFILLIFYYSFIDHSFANLSCRDMTRNSHKYTSLIRRLYDMNKLHPAKLDLSNSNQLYDLLGRPLDKVHVVHIAG